MNEEGHGRQISIGSPATVTASTRSKEVSLEAFPLMQGKEMDSPQGQLELGQCTATALPSKRKKRYEEGDPSFQAPIPSIMHDSLLQHLRIR